MKSPLRMFRGMKLNKVESKEVKQQRRPSTKPEELMRATQDMHEMRSCYDSLLSAAATTANNAHEFSEALEELGTCLLQKTALNDDEDSGRALMMMGKTQFDLQKHFDSYRTHILHTMDKPSRSLLSEIENVEEMKRLCDDRRETYRNKLVASGGKGKSCHSQEKNSMKELLEAQDNYEDEAARFVFRIKSLKKGQFQSLLTQATRHHAAQLSFFRNGLKALEIVESQVKAVADRHHINYSVSDLEDDGSDDDDGTYGSDDEGLSFDRERSFQEQNVVYISGNYIEEKTCKSQSGMHKSNLRTPYSSQSAPIPANKKLDSAKKIETLPAVTKFHSYVLPTPRNDRNPNPSPHTVPSLETPTPCNDRIPSPHTTPHPSPHSTPLETKASQSPKESEFSSTSKSSRNSTTTGNIIYSGPIRMQSDFSEKPSGPRFNRHDAYAAHKLNQHSFSGPLTNQPFSNKPIVSPQYSHSTEFPHPVSLASQQMPKPKSSISPNVASRTLPPVTSLKISELHELPRPPPIGLEKATGPSSFIGYSGPLVSRAKNNMMSSRPSSVHPLPKPLGQMGRSFSNPSNSRRIPVFSASKLLEIPQNPVRIEEITSPPPAHLPLTTMLPVSTTS